MGIRQVPPTIKDPNLAGFLRELRAAIGGVSDQVTKIIATRSSSSGGGTNPVNPPGTNPPGPTPGGNGYPPPAPLSLEAVPGAFSVTLVWTNPDIPDLQATEVWAQRSFDAWNASYEYLANAKVLVNGTVYRSRKAQSVNSTTNVVTLNKNFPPATSPEWWEATTLAPTEKSYVGESAGTSWIHDGLTPGETWAYWVRNRDIENLFSTYFPNDDVGIVTTTLLDPGAYLDLLTNSITATQLYSDLGSRINLIDGPDNLIGSVNNRAKDLRDQFDTAIGNVVDGVTDIAVQTESGYTTLRALKTSTETSSAAIGEINNVSATTTSANAQKLFGIRADVYNPETGIASKASLTELNQAKSDIYGASVETFTNLNAEFGNKQAQINEINNVSSTSTSANAQKLFTLDAAINTGPTSLSAQIAELNNVSVDSTSANASKLAQVSASNATKVSVFFQTAAPTSTGRVTGDLWYDTDDNNKEYRWSGSAWVVYRTATKTYSQTTAPTSTTASPLYPGDLWIDTTTEVVNGSSVPRNKTYRWSGSSWVDVSNGSYSEAKASALVTNLEQTKIGYCTINNLATDHTTKSTCEAAGGTWHVGLPMATAVKQVSVSDGTSSVALEQRFIAQKTTNDNLYAQYTVKIDNQGWVSGFGLASEVAQDGTPRSDFGIRADRFWIAAPTSPTPASTAISLNQLSALGQYVVAGCFYGKLNTTDSSPNWYAYVQCADNPNASVNSWVSLRNVRASANTTGDNAHAYFNGSFTVAMANRSYYYNDIGNGYGWTTYTPIPGLPSSSNVLIFKLAGNYSLGYGYTTNQTTGQYSDPAQIISARNARLPFIVTTTPQTYNGQRIDAGVFIDAAWIVDASITNAKIYGDIHSADYNGEEAGGSGYGTAGWCINKTGRAVFNTLVVRDAKKNIDPNLLVRAQGFDFDFGTTIFGGAGLRDSNDVTYSFLHTSGTPISFTLAFSMQVPSALRYLAVQYSYDSYTWVTWYVVYDDAKNSDGGVLSGRHLSATKTAQFDVFPNQYVKIRFQYRVDSTGNQPIANVKLSILECYR